MQRERQPRAEPVRQQQIDQLLRQGLQPAGVGLRAHALRDNALEGLCDGGDLLEDRLGGRDEIGDIGFLEAVVDHAAGDIHQRLRTIAQRTEGVDGGGEFRALERKSEAAHQDGETLRRLQRSDGRREEKPEFREPAFGRTWHRNGLSEGGRREAAVRKRLLAMRIESIKECAREARNEPMRHIQFRVHPAVGIARMGNSPAAFHISNEFPIFLQEKFSRLRPNPTPRTHPWDFVANVSKDVKAAGFAILNTTDAATNKYKDNAGRVMPQAARFRIFAYVYGSAEPTAEPLRVVEVSAEIAEIEWQVWLGNVKSITSTGGRKNAFNRSAAPLSVSTAGGAKAAVLVKNAALPALGTLLLEQTSADKAKVTGRLLVIGNSGDTQGTTRPSGLWSDNWFDSAADGPVTAVIKPDMAKLRLAAGIAAGEALHYLDHGVAAPKAAAAGQAINALGGWCVVGLPDYSPDMGHFVSVHDIGLEGGYATLEATDVALKARAEPGQHRRVDDKAVTDSYRRWDYDVHILPHLCLFTDVNNVSSYANAKHADAAGDKLGHNKPAAPARLMIRPRDAADDADLRANGKMTKPANSTATPRDWLKQGLLGRLRKPGTLYRNTRNFIKSRSNLASDSTTYDTQKVFPRRLGRRIQFDNGTRYPTDGAAVKATEAGLPFPHEVTQPANLKEFYPKIDRTTRLCGAEKSFKQKGGAAATDTQRLIDDLYWPATPADMPLLRELAYTHEQYDHFTDWASAAPTKNDAFYATIVGAALTTYFQAAHTQDEYFDELLKQAEAFAPAMLDLAHLGSMLGGSFLPGIEVGREAGIPQNWSLYHGASRRFLDVRFQPCNGAAPHPPGMLGKDLAIPWQKDYTACNETYWPTSRAGQVVRETAPGTFIDGREWMMAEAALPTVAGESAVDRSVRFYKSYWHMLGFVRREGTDRFVERERAPGI
ncbi:LodA/GoxA family CTQ-dependent oxidase [Humitalea sp. 24SJ18S-53]|uniref:LodA/GoxA family CTQ-dependent oxidase n=1 Tax=Humitalea sp. 24SJ18S-53 TaxID=3422307 RepID=UPI003D679579